MKIMKDKTKQVVKKQNAAQFFNDLILSIVPKNHTWTPAQRMQYNRVSKFLEG